LEVEELGARVVTEAHLALTRSYLLLPLPVVAELVLTKTAMDLLEVLEVALGLWAQARLLVGPVTLHLYLPLKVAAEAAVT
jgi:hypothetical protein